jgi:hypothetical protein
LYEHASIPATATAQFIGDPLTNAPFKREQYANTLLGLLEDIAPRDDQPDWAAQPAELSASAVSRAAAPAAKLHTDHVEEVHQALAAANPEMAAQMDPTAVKTEGDASAFVATAMAVLHPQAGQATAEGSGQ